MIVVAVAKSLCSIPDDLGGLRAACAFANREGRGGMKIFTVDGLPEAKPEFRNNGIYAFGRKFRAGGTGIPFTKAWSKPGSDLMVGLRGLPDKPCEARMFVKEGRRGWEEFRPYPEIRLAAFPDAGSFLSEVRRSAEARRKSLFEEAGKHGALADMHRTLAEKTRLEAEGINPGDEALKAEAALAANGLL